MIKIKEAIIVEGKYDKIKLSNIIDGLIITVDGFSLFKDAEKQRLIRNLAKSSGILVLTDSDSAGFVIRNFLSGIVDPSQIKHAYIKEISGRERRKNKDSKEGLLGVEGVTEEEILEAVKKSGILVDSDRDNPDYIKKITVSDLYEFGLTGGENSAELRKKLLKRLDLPSKLSTKAMLDIINKTMSYDTLIKILKENLL